jgi:hypothetical protein
MSGPRRIRDLLTPSGSPLAALVRRAGHQQQLDARLGAFLDRPLLDHIQAAGGENGVLVLVADTPVWGHRIRYLAPTILQQMQRHEPELREVRIIVRPGRSQPHRAATPTRRTLSRSSASLLEHVAATCDNPALARVLTRLGARARKR